MTIEDFIKLIAGSLGPNFNLFGSLISLGQTEKIFDFSRTTNQNTYYTITDSLTEGLK